VSSLGLGLSGVPQLFRRVSKIELTRELMPVTTMIYFIISTLKRVNGCNELNIGKP
jgi:hypothetical protein